MEFVDAHVHLGDSEYQDRIDEIVAVAKKTGIVAMVSNSTDLETSKRSLELAEKHPGLVYAAVGIHPWNANQLAPLELQTTVEFIQRNAAVKEGIVALGEIGFDPQYTKRKEQKELQIKVFTEMLQLAEQFSLPIIVHSRWSAEKMLGMLHSYRLKHILWHWFSGSSETLNKIVERGDYISEGPSVAYSERIQQIVRNVPLDRLLTETDGPVRYQGPFKGGSTTPALIPQTVKVISQLRESEESCVAEQILRNFACFFDI